MNALAERIRAALTDDLLKPEYRGGTRPFSGHCYVASEAYYHLTGRTHAPKRLRVNGVTHWWLEAPDGGIIDLTAEQFDGPVDYARGVGAGFLTREPSKRARIVIERVREATRRACDTGRAA